MNVLPFVVITIIIALILIYFLRSGLDNEKHAAGKKKRNDKIIIIKNINYSDLRKLIVDFCKMYNKRDRQAVPRLISISETEFAVTFPLDIDFEIFCYFINYLHNPTGHASVANVTGWTTARPGDPWINTRSVNKNVMLFVPAGDSEKDGVYLTTSDDIGYILRFGFGENEQLLDIPGRNYVAPSIGADSLVDKSFEDIV